MNAPEHRIVPHTSEAETFDEADIRALVRMIAATAENDTPPESLADALADRLGADFRMRTATVCDPSGAVVVTGVDYRRRGGPADAFVPIHRSIWRDASLRVATGEAEAGFPDPERVIFHRTVSGRSVRVFLFGRDPVSPPFGDRERNLAALAFDTIPALTGLRRSAAGRHATPAPFTGRRREVVRHLRAGLSSKEIASEMAISVNTVNDHLKAIFRTLGVNTREALVRRLADSGAR